MRPEPTTTETFSIERFQWRAYTLTLKLYALVLILQLIGLAVATDPAVQTWQVMVQLGLGFALVLPLLALSRRGPSRVQIQVFLGLMTVIQVPSLFLAEPLLVLMWFAALVVVWSVVYALLSPPRIAMMWSFVLTALLCGSMLFRFKHPASLRFSTETHSQFSQYVLYTVGLLIAAALLVRWLTQGFHKATVESQQMAQALQESNVQLAQARDEALQAARLKSALLENMSHELRTPLNAILGYAELLQEELEDLSHPEATELSKDTRKIHKAGTQLLVLVQQVLDLATLEDQPQGEATNVSLVALIDELRHQVQPLAGNNHNQLDLRIEDGLDEFPTSYVNLHKILWILLENACKFTTEGNVVLSIARDETRDAIRCTVKDDGIGITKEQRERVFELFEQGDMSTNKRHQGLGVGLALAAQLAARLGAQLDVASEPGQGATFVLTLPQQREAQVG